MKFVLFVALLIAVIFIESIMIIDYEITTKRHITDIENVVNKAVQKNCICPETATSTDRFSTCTPDIFFTNTTDVFSTSPEESIKP